jgi:uncharacterized membrane protein
MSSDAALLALGMVLPGAYCLALGRWLSWRWALGGLLGASALAAWVAAWSRSPYGSALAALMLLALAYSVGLGQERPPLGRKVARTVGVLGCMAGLASGAALLALYALQGQVGHGGDTVQTVAVLATAMAAAWALGLGAALAVARHPLAGGLGMLIMGLMCSYVFMQMMGFAGGLTLTYGGVIALASALRGGPRPPATAQNA